MHRNKHNIYYGNHDKYDHDDVVKMTFEEKLGQICMTTVAKGLMPKGSKLMPITFEHDSMEYIKITNIGGIEMTALVDIDAAFASQNIPPGEWDNVDVKNSTDTAVKKYIWTKEDAIAESVLYAYPTYEERTVMCISTMTGCPMGCTFCGTGEFFGRSLTSDEMIEQVTRMALDQDIDLPEVKKLQIMFMSMGEPILNSEMSVVYSYLREIAPNAALLVSTSGPKTKEGWNALMNDAAFNHQIGLQFSVHESTDEARDKLIPMKAKLNLEEIALKGLEFFQSTGRKPFFNYCAHEANVTDEDVMRLRMLFDPRIWECTISVICEKDQAMSDAVQHQLDMINDFSSRMVQVGYNTRVFNPAGQDDIGGGCGQLWQVQKFAAENPNIMKQSPGNKIACKQVEA